MKKIFKIILLSILVTSCKSQGLINLSNCAVNSSNSLYSANNGLTENPTNNFQLGGTLIFDTTVDGDNNQFDLNFTNNDLVRIDGNSIRVSTSNNFGYDLQTGTGPYRFRGRAYTIQPGFFGTGGSFLLDMFNNASVFVKTTEMKAGNAPLGSFLVNTQSTPTLRGLIEYTTWGMPQDEGLENDYLVLVDDPISGWQMQWKNGQRLDEEITTATLTASCEASYWVDTYSNAVTATLPNGAPNGCEVIIARNGTNNITVNPVAPTTISNAASFVITTDEEKIIYKYDLSRDNWIAIRN